MGADRGNAGRGPGNVSLSVAIHLYARPTYIGPISRPVTLGNVTLSSRYTGGAWDGRVATSACYYKRWPGDKTTLLHLWLSDRHEFTAAMFAGPVPPGMPHVPRLPVEQLPLGRTRAPSRDVFRYRFAQQLCPKKLFGGNAIPYARMIGVFLLVKSSWRHRHSTPTFSVSIPRLLVDTKEIIHGCLMEEKWAWYNDEKQTQIQKVSP